MTKANKNRFQIVFFFYSFLKKDIIILEWCDKMKTNKFAFKRMSTGLAALIIAITMASCSNKKEDINGFHIDITDNTSLSQHIEEYQELLNRAEDTIINDYNEYLKLYYNLINTEKDVYHKIRKEYETTWIDGKKIECESKAQESNGETIYYNNNKINGTIKRIYGNSVEIKDGAYKYTFTLDNNELSIKINNKYSSKYDHKVILKSDNSYSIEIENETYSFDSKGILISSNHIENNISYVKKYVDGNINVYTEYQNDKISKITKEDGSYTEIYYGYLPTKVKEKFPVYKNNSTYETITIEYDKDDNIISSVFETNNESENSKIEMKPDGSYYGTKKYIGTDSSTTEIIEQCNSEGEVQKTTKKYNTDGKLITTEVHKITKDDITKLRTIDGKVVEELKDDILYFYDNEGNILEYYKYLGNNYVIYDANGIKKEFHNVDKREIITYYEDGNIESINNNYKYVEFYNSKKIKHYHNKDKETTINAGGVNYTLEYYDEISFYESGKLKATIDHDKGIKKEYYESSVLKYIKENDKDSEYWYNEDKTIQKYIVNGNGKSYYKDRTIYQEYIDGKVVKSYYENGQIEYEKTENGEKEYYEDGTPKEIKENDKTTYYYESGEVKAISSPGHSIEYNEDGSIHNKSDEMLKTYYKDGVICEYINSGSDNKTINIDGKSYIIGPFDNIKVYPSGKIKEINKDTYKKSFYENGNVSYEKHMNYEKYYYENGNLKKVLDNGNGKSYYENGNEFATYKDGIVIKSLHENGNLKSKKIDNIEKTYYDNGQIENVYIDGERTESHHKNGNISYTNYNGEDRSYYENGVISSEIINGVKYTYYMTGELRSTTENDITTEYRDNRVYSVGTFDHKVIYPIEEDYSFIIVCDNKLSEDKKQYESSFQYYYNDQLLYTSETYDFSGYDYDNEYGITQVLIYSRDDQQKYSIYVNEDYYGNAK